MESKHGRATEGLLRTYKLLIEPVWNRNLIDKVVTGVTDLLLIEPVWNRNQWVFDIAFECPPFNRTSMESKQEYQQALTGLNLLLIEPVWNRNDVDNKLLADAMSHF